MRIWMGLGWSLWKKIFQCFANSIPENLPRRPAAGIDAMGRLPCALNVKVKKFNDMQVTE